MRNIKYKIKTGHNYDVWVTKTIHGKPRATSRNNGKVNWFENAIANTIARFIGKGLPADEIAVLSPFRAQAANIRRHIRRHPRMSQRCRV